MLRRFQRTAHQILDASPIFSDSASTLAGDLYPLNPNRIRVPRAFGDSIAIMIVTIRFTINTNRSNRSYFAANVCCCRIERNYVFRIPNILFAELLSACLSDISLNIEMRVEDSVFFQDLHLFCIFNLLLKYLKK